MGQVATTVRLVTLMSVMIAGALGVGARLFWLQVMDSERMSEMAAEQRLRSLDLPAQRGSILASDGTELAISMPTQTVYASPREVADPARTAVLLADALGIDKTILQEKLSGDGGFVYLARRQSDEVGARVEELDLPGVGLLEEPKRFYPSGDLAAAVLGFVGDDNVGLAGLESQYDDLLTGIPGKAVVERDPAGRVIPVGRSSIREPVQGNDLILTIDRQIQHQAEEALARAVSRWNAIGGSIVVMRPGTGDVLAIANNPTYDPNDFQAARASDRRNRAVVDVFEPGSVSKMVTAAAALESGVVTPAEMMNVNDKLRIGSKIFSDSHPHPTEWMSFAQVIQSSSNVGTIKVAERMGSGSLYEYLMRFGYGRKTGLDFPGEPSGIVPPPDSWWETSLGTISIGQGVAITPMQLARAYATLANGGVEVEPKLVLATTTAEGEKVYREPTVGRRAIEPETGRRLSEILAGVVESGAGTGNAAAIPGYRVAGKTGTAQKPVPGAAGYAGYMATFVGFAPVENPQLVVSVVLDDPVPFLAGQTAAVTFREVMEFSLRRLRAGTVPSSRVLAGTVPDVLAGP